MKEKQTPKGVIKYRMPNIAEGFEYLAVCERIRDGADVLRTRGKIISIMFPLLDMSALGYASYAEALEDKDNLYGALSEISEEIYEDIIGALIKKNSSLMPSV